MEKEPLKSVFTAATLTECVSPAKSCTHPPAAGDQGHGGKKDKDKVHGEEGGDGDGRCSAPDKLEPDQHVEKREEKKRRPKNQ